MNLTSGRTEIQVLTPLATGAIAVVQVVGPEALAIAERVFRSRRGRPLCDRPLGQVVYGEFVGAGGEVFDDGLAVRGVAVDVPWVEFNLHGGVRIVQRLIQAAQGSGAVLAQPATRHCSNSKDSMATNDVAMAPGTTLEGGTQPANDHGPATAQDHATRCGSIPPGPHARKQCERGTRIAEGTGTQDDPSFAWVRPLEGWMHACLAEAATQRVVRWLAGQPGLWREQVGIWIERIDRGDLQTVLNEVAALVSHARRYGQVWRGRTIAIIGPPNVGKSTLANRLAGRDVSLVADIPGTTRDWVGEPIAVQGWPITIIDTAGLRVGQDAVEAEGIARARDRAARADVRLLVLDASGPDGQPRRMLLDQLGLKVYDIVVYNKCDLPCRPPGRGRDAGLAANQDVFVSSLTGQGWSALEQEISAACGFAVLQEPKPLVFCAELHDRLADLVAALRSQQALGARTVLEAL